MLEKINGKQLNASILAKNLIDSEQAKNDLSFYDIVYVIQNDTKTSFKKSQVEGIQVTLAFTNRELCQKHTLDSDRVRAITVGMLCKETKSNSIEVIGIDLNEANQFDDFIFAPPYDELTGQFIISPRDEAISLLSIDNESHRFMGVKATFFSITNKALVTMGLAEREEYLNELIDNLGFIIPRIPQPKGSANIICLLLNLENPIEERAFVRDYPTFDSYTEVLFVNSELDLLTGDLTKIKYDGASLEGVYLPLIKRNKEVK